MLLHRDIGQLLFTLLCVGITTAFFPADLQAGEPYHWPLDPPTHLTSTIGEYRGDHLHNGIDFSTLNQAGRPVRAVDTGVVSRVTFDPDKYGITVVIRHEDGRQSWYSHLRNVSRRIRGSLDQSIEKNRTINVEERLPVDRGETIGIAGQTGRGGRHLHFALRDADGTFINPIGRFEPELPFEGQPAVQSIHLMPLGDNGWIDGQPTDRVYRELPRRRIPLWGRIGLGVSLRNNHPGVGNRSLPETVELIRDGKVVAKHDFSKLSTKRQDTGVYRVFNTNRSNLNPTRFTINLTPMTDTGAWRGMQFRDTDQTGQLTLKITASNGRSTRRVIAYRAVPPPATFQWFPAQVEDEKDVLDYEQLTRIRPASPEFLVASLTGRQTALKQYSPPQYSEFGSPPDVSIDYEWAMNRLRFTVQVDGSWQGWPSLEVRQDTFVATPPLIQVEPGKFVTWWEPSLERDGWHQLVARVRGEDRAETEQERFYAQALRQGREGVVAGLSGRYSLYHPERGLAFSSFVNFQSIDEQLTPRDGLQSVDQPRRIEPTYLQSRRGGVLTADLPDTLDQTAHVGLYRYNRVAERWEPLSHETGFSSDSLEGRIFQLGTIGLFEDTVPPSIESVERTGEGAVVVQCRDEGSGIARESIAVEIDGYPVDFRWHEDKNRIKLSIPAGTSLSNHELRIHVADRSGRETEWRGLIGEL